MTKTEIFEEAITKFLVDKYNLSPTELEFFFLVLKGYKAETMRTKGTTHRALGSCKFHIGNVYNKLGINRESSDFNARSVLFSRLVGSFYFYNKYTKQRDFITFADYFSHVEDKEPPEIHIKEEKKKEEIDSPKFNTTSLPLGANTLEEEYKEDFVNG